MIQYFLIPRTESEQTSQRRDWIISPAVTLSNSSLRRSEKETESQPQSVVWGKWRGSANLTARSSSFWKSTKHKLVPPKPHKLVNQAHLQVQPKISRWRNCRWKIGGLELRVRSSGKRWGMPSPTSLEISTQKVILHFFQIFVNFVIYRYVVWGQIVAQLCDLFHNYLDLISLVTICISKLRSKRNIVQQCTSLRLEVKMRPQG